MEKLLFRPMDSAEFDTNMNIYLEEYIADISKYEEEFKKTIGFHPREFSEKQFKDNLPEGINTPNNFFWIGVHKSNGHEIGYFWFSIVPDKRLSVLSQMHIHEKFRGLGYKSEILYFWEDYVKTTHPEIDYLYLHLFKHYPETKKLYEEFGFSTFFESFEGDNLIKYINRKSDSS